MCVYVGSQGAGGGYRRKEGVVERCFRERICKKVRNLERELRFWFWEERERIFRYEIGGGGEEVYGRGQGGVRPEVG